MTYNFTLLNYCKETNINLR